MFGFLFLRKEGKRSVKNQSNKEIKIKFLVKKKKSHFSSRHIQPQQSPALGPPSPLPAAGSRVGCAIAGGAAAVAPPRTSLAPPGDLGTTQMGGRGDTKAALRSLVKGKEPGSSQGREKPLHRIIE